MGVWHHAVSQGTFQAPDEQNDKDLMSVLAVFLLK